MSDGVMKALLWGMLFIILVALFYMVHRRFKEKNVWGALLKKYRDSVDNKLLSEAEFVTRYGAVEDHSLLYRFDRLVLTSGIGGVIPFASGESVLLFMGGLGIAGLIEGFLIFHNVFVALFLCIAQATLVYVLLIALAAKNYNQIEDDIPIFISILCNHAKGSSDIVTIMEQTSVSLHGPLKHIVRRFITDAEQTGNVDIAFDYMKESVENRQLQTIIMNLKNCMHFQANYEDVLMQMTRQVAAGLTAREDRKNVLFSMKITLVAISVVALVIVWLIGTGLGIDVKGSLTGTTIGQLLLFLTGVLYLFVLTRLFGTDK